MTDTPEEPDTAPGSDPSEAPAEAMRRAVTDLWSQIVEADDDAVVFFDHFGNPARIRREEGKYRIGWKVIDAEPYEWQESPRAFDNPREAALHAFQGSREISS
ncbi:MAG TPA: hypothetical protein VG815_19085 [Chloroflexota bacterium]|jgi:hypothetical protein|nr:hypothetical protein [Chloroflexota bacterium]